MHDLPHTALVLVSHSRKLAEGLQQLIQEMAQDVTIRIAAGDEHGGLGTQAEAIIEAIRMTEAEKVLLFFDLGSALMNAELAIDLMCAEGEHREVIVVDAPLVEGSFAAAMALQTGKGTSEAVQAAENTRQERKKR